MESHPTIYDSIGEGYRGLRVPDPRIAAAILAALGDAQTVCNVGAGSGSYEPTDRQVTAVEPSQKMIDQRRSDSPVVQATAEALPFPNDHFDAAMAVLTVHHWTDPLQGLREMQRISKRQVVFSFDPERIDSLWLVRDYLPEVVEWERRRALPIQSIADALRPATISEVWIPWDCSDGFQAAYWRRPEAYLDAHVRSAISTLAQLPQPVVAAAIRRLNADLESGVWHDRYAELLELDEMDFGYRLVVSESRFYSESL